MKIDILTLFPDQINAVMQGSIMGKAQEKGLISIRAVNIRDYTLDKHRRADDAPYGGGRGMVMTPQPLFDCHAAIKTEKSYTILMSPGGNTLDQQRARELLTYDHLILVCGHYEGLDQRFIDLCVDAELSIGDFVLTGGELPAMVVADAVCRMVPGVLPSEECFTQESHYSGCLEHPQYTRPEVFRDLSVPPVLVSGHHANIVKWRRKRSLEKTRAVRPDLFEKLVLDKNDLKILENPDI